jgi:hypothetical protein
VPAQAQATAAERVRYADPADMGNDPDGSCAPAASALA